jgi:hypothetical protein
MRGTTFPIEFAIVDRLAPPTATIHSAPTAELKSPNAPYSVKVLLSVCYGSASTWSAFVCRTLFVLSVCLFLLFLYDSTSLLFEDTGVPSLHCCNHVHVTACHSARGDSKPASFSQIAMSWHYLSFSTHSNHSFPP